MPDVDVRSVTARGLKDSLSLLVDECVSRASVDKGVVVLTPVEYRSLMDSLLVSMNFWLRLRPASVRFATSTASTSST